MVTALGMIRTSVMAKPPVMVNLPVMVTLTGLVGLPAVEPLALFSSGLDCFPIDDQAAFAQQAISGARIALPSNA